MPLLPCWPKEPKWQAYELWISSALPSLFLHPPTHCQFAGIEQVMARPAFTLARFQSTGNRAGDGSSCVL